MKPKLTIVYPCVGSKTLVPEIYYDKCKTPSDWKTYHDISSHKVRAIDLYTGTGFTIVKNTLDKLREHFDLDVYILSAGYSLIPEDKMIAGYNCTFSSSAKEDKVKKKDWSYWLRSMSDIRLPKGTVCVLPKSYSAPYNTAFGDLEDMILIQADGADREAMGSSMIHASFNLMDGIVNKAIERGAYPPMDTWSSIRGWDVNDI